MKENTGVLSQQDLLEIMPCIICTCCKFDPSLGHQWAVSLKCNIALGRVSRTLSFAYKILQFMPCVFYISCCIGIMESILQLGSVTLWKHFPWNFLFGGVKVKKLDKYRLPSQGFMKVWLHGWSREVRMAMFRVHHFFFVVMQSVGSSEGQSINVFVWVYPSQW